MPSRHDILLLLLPIIVTSGCPWPLATVKSPGFFKLGSCFSFFYKLLTFLLFYFYVFSIFIIILYNKNKVFLFHFYIYFYLDASLKFGDIFLFGCKFEVWRKKRHVILFQVGFFFNIYKFYFLFIFTLYLVSSFLEIFFF